MRSQYSSITSTDYLSISGYALRFGLLLLLLVGLAACEDSGKQETPKEDGDTPIADGDQDDDDDNDNPSSDGDGETIDCDDQDPCTLDTLGPDGCLHNAKDCSRYDTQCALGVCDSDDGSCRQQIYDDNRSCDDGDDGTIEDTCDNGSCRGIQSCGEGYKVGDYRECTLENQYGSCTGTQLCNSDQTFTDCSGQTPEAEACDGVDNDCDEDIDEAEDLVYRFCQEQRGVCEGAKRQCGGVAGWLTCTAQTYQDHHEAYETVETRCDNLDNDCDGLVDEGCDNDHDGYCDQTMTVAEDVEVCPYGGGDCNDDRDRIHPGRTELCDGIDNDCDDIIDNPDSLDHHDCFFQDGVCEGSGQRCEGASGWQACTENDYRTYSEDYEHLIETLCDGLDNDCDGLVDEGCDNDEDGYCDQTMTVIGTPEVCPHGGQDCDDQNEAIHPTAPERCDNYDNDCDEAVDELEDLELVLCPNQQGVCTQSRKRCLLGLWQTCTNDTYLSHNASFETGTESLCDDLDNNCNGQTDEGCNNDEDAYCDAAMTTVGTPQTCVMGGGDCQDDNDQVFPSQVEFCDGLDNNCDSLVDDPEHLEFMACALEDGVCTTTQRRCEGENGWQDCKYWDYKTQAPAYQLEETACDNLDNDCDGQTDLACIYDADLDGISLDQGDCNDLDPTIWPSQPAIPFVETIPSRHGGSGQFTLWTTDEAISLSENDLLVYEILFDGGSSVCRTGLTLVDDDSGWSLIENHPELIDSHGLTIAAQTDLCAQAKGSWTTRDIFLPAAVAGQTIDSLTIVIPESTHPTRVSLRNLVLFNAMGNVKVLFHSEEEAFSWPDNTEPVATNLLSYQTSLRAPQSTEFPDGIDNNCDGEVDEGTQGRCDAPIELEAFSTIERDLFGQGPLLEASCAPESGGDASLFHLISPISGRLYLSTEGSAIDTVLSVRQNCSASETEILCNDDQPSGSHSVGYVDVQEQDELFIQVSSAVPGGGGLIRLQSVDATDYDEDGSVYPFDCDEEDPNRHPGAEEQCDGVDNDCNGTEDDGCDDDLDEDNVTPRQGDCNDDDPLTYPDAEELCDGKDNDCDEIIDNGCDVDEDHTTVPDDCDDQDPLTYPGAEEICDGKDNDCDEIIDNGCDVDEDQATVPDDCDDQDPLTYPGAEELCDGKDNDCDEIIDNGCDVDEDHTTVPDDCDDQDPLTYPGAEELCDGKDNDCDEIIDNGCDVDEDQATVPDDCDDQDPLTYPGAEEICWDGKDNDCDPDTPMNQGCEGADCFHPIELSLPVAVSLPFVGLPDSTRSQGCALEAPDGPELRLAFTAQANKELIISTEGSSLDTVLSLRSQCQDATSELACNDDANGQPSSGLQWSVVRGERYSLIVDSKAPVENGLLSLTIHAVVDQDNDGMSPPLDCNDEDPTIYDGAPELCDTKDHNCNEVVDDGCDTDQDNDGYTPRQGDCDDLNPNRNPGEEESAHCNGIDNDCDGIIDDGCDEDHDEFPIPSDCNDNQASIHPGVPEICGNGIDDNCNGTADDGCDFDDDGVTVPHDCNDRNEAIHPNQDDICGNGIDDNCDGNVDEGCVGTCHRPLWITVPGEHLTGQSDLASSRHLGSCYPYPGKENVYAFVAPSDSTLYLTTEGSDFDTLLYVREGLCEDPTRELACSDDAPTITPQSGLHLSVQEGTSYFVFVDSADTPQSQGGGQTHLHITVED